MGLNFVAKVFQALHMIQMLETTASLLASVEIQLPQPPNPRSVPSFVGQLQFQEPFYYNYLGDAHTVGEQLFYAITNAHGGLCARVWEAGL